MPVVPKATPSPPHLDAFELTACGSYRFRYGPVGRGAAHSKKKVCLVATDRPFLVGLLHELSLRDDCFYVKYSTYAREGMLLGRVFMITDDAAGRLCEELKSHPKLFASIQDDDFFAPFRAASP